MKLSVIVSVLLLCAFFASPLLRSENEKNDNKPVARNDVMQWQAAREKNSPKVGDKAPDFERPILDMKSEDKESEKKSDGKPATFKLSDYKDTSAVVLVFASFT